MHAIMQQEGEAIQRHILFPILLLESLLLLLWLWPTQPRSLAVVFCLEILFISYTESVVGIGVIQRWPHSFSWLSDYELLAHIYNRQRLNYNHHCPRLKPGNRHHHRRRCRFFSSFSFVYYLSLLFVSFSILRVSCFQVLRISPPQGITRP